MKELNNKNKEFCEKYVSNGYNGTAAYASVYEQDNLNHAAVWASQLLKQERIRSYIDVVEWSFKLIGHKEWVDKTTIIKVLKEMLSATKEDKTGNEVPDWTARNSAVNSLSKLAWYVWDWSTEKWGDLEDNKWEVNVSEMTDEEKKIYREKIIEEL